LPKASLTVTSSGLAKAVFTAVLCGVPEVAVTLAAGAGGVGQANEAGVDTPATEAVTL